MSLKIDIPQPELMKPKITIFGVGGAGGNAINNMMRSNLEGVEFVAANTDSQSLTSSLAKNRIQLGVRTTRGLGAGSFPDKGKIAAEENMEEIDKYLEGNNMIFIAAGMGGGTGTGAAPVIAKLAHEKDILTVGVVTKPFFFEGKYRMEIAEAGIEELKKYVDTLIVIPNQNLFRIANEQTTFESAFKMADDVLHAGVRGITDLITMPGLVNLDFADIRTIMTKMGKAMMGTGEATGENRAIIACEAAVSNPLLDDISIKGAKGVLVNMTGGPDMTLFEADMAVSAIKKEVDPNANIIFGSAFNENMKGKIRISVVATGIDAEEFRRDAMRAQESHEPSRFKVDIADNSKKYSGLNSATNKNFFDPGVSSKVKKETIADISNTPQSFKTEHTHAEIEAADDYIAEEDDERIETETVITTKRSSFSETDEFTQVSFFGNQLDQALDRDKEENEERKAPKFDPKKSAKLTKAAVKEEEPKRENTGFSLFSFMNSVKSQKEVAPVAAPRQEVAKKEVVRKEIARKEVVQPEPEFFEEEEEVIHEAPRRTQPPISHQHVQHAAPAELKRSAEAEKKRREFFGSTIFDEKASENDHKIDDDILNVPAFFRRKK